MEQKRLNDELDSFDGHMRWLDKWYPPETFDGSSGDPGPTIVKLTRALAAANERAERLQVCGTCDYNGGTRCCEPQAQDDGFYWETGNDGRLQECAFTPSRWALHEVIARRTEGDAWRDVSGNGTSDDLPPAGDPASGWRGDDGGEPEGRHD